MRTWECLLLGLMVITVVDGCAIRVFSGGRHVPRWSESLVGSTDQDVIAFFQSRDFVARATVVSCQQIETTGDGPRTSYWDITVYSETVLLSELLPLHLVTVRSFVRPKVRIGRTVLLYGKYPESDPGHLWGNVCAIDRTGDIEYVYLPDDKNSRVFRYEWLENNLH